MRARYNLKTKCVKLTKSMNLPNALTVSRIFLVPVLLVVLLTGRFAERELWGFVVFAAAAITDYFDGYFARKRFQVTTLGKLLDPIADKLLISAAFVALVEWQVAPSWMVIIVIGREFAVTGLRSIASTQGLTIDASRLGKYKMASQVLCVSALILGTRYTTWLRDPVGKVLLWLVVVLAFVSMVQYFRRFWSQIDESIKYPKLQNHGEAPLKHNSGSNAVINP